MRLDFHVAALRDVHGAAQRIRHFPEHLRHLRRGLEIKLVGRELHAMRVAHGLAGLNAQQDFLRVRVVVMQIVAIVGGHQRNSGFFRQPHQFRVHAFLDFQPLILNLQEEIVLCRKYRAAGRHSLCAWSYFSSTTASVTGPRRHAESAINPLLCLASRS